MNVALISDLLSLLANHQIWLTGSGLSSANATQPDTQLPVRTAPRTLIAPAHMR